VRSELSISRDENLGQLFRAAEADVGFATAATAAAGVVDLNLEDETEGEENYSDIEDS